MKAHLAAVTFLLLAGQLAAQPAVELGGYWERWLGGSFYDSVLVPSSYRPIGTARLIRSVDLPRLDSKQRAILRFEGVANEAIARVNGREVGRMGPWIPYEFDITAASRPGTNSLEVEVTDWQAPLGPTGGWESYGGIVRRAWIEIRPDPYIRSRWLPDTRPAGAADRPLFDPVRRRRARGLPLRWGVEIVRSNRIAVASRLNPVALHAAPVIEYLKDPSREDYQTLLLSLPVQRKRVRELHIELDGTPIALPPSSLPNSTGSLYKAGGYALLVFAVTAERVPE